jgi:CPA1 family monovalent cation:H+ antiporter
LEKNAHNVQAIIDRDNHEAIQSFIKLLGIFAVTIMFLALADMVNFSQLKKYWKEIISVFVASTAIRMVVMAKFSALSNMTKYMHNISFSWYKVMVFGGVKGCLSLIMLHLIPDSVSYKPLFEAIVTGVILLTTFIYPIFLIGTLKLYGNKLNVEYS